MPRIEGKNSPKVAPLKPRKRCKWCNTALGPAFARVLQWSGSVGDAPEGYMQVSRKSVLRSSHDLILIVGAVIAIAWMLVSTLHHYRITPPSVGMISGTRMASFHIGPH